MARAAVGWTVRQLAEKAQVGAATVNRFEMGHADPNRSTLAAIRAALEAAGVEFTNGEAPGVRMRKGSP